MYPELLGVRLYNPMLLLAVILGSWLHLRLVGRAGYPRMRTFLFLLALAPISWLGPKLYSMYMFGGFGGWQSELSGGYRYPGSVLSMLIGPLLLQRLLPQGLDVRRWGDLMVPGFVLMLAIGRVGCLLNGCCTGEVCDLPWALPFPSETPAWYLHRFQGLIDSHASLSLPVHPLAGYFFLLEVTTVVGALWLLRRKHYDGQVVLFFLTFHGIGKTALEFLREPYDVRHQTVPLALALVALTTMVMCWWRSRAEAGAEAS
jgi:phosphatidylglycerol:prolipoprotein diacylglycerol transferase